MEQAIEQFITYLHNVKKTSANTEMSYRRDLKKVAAFLNANGLTDLVNVKEADLKSYIVFMNEQHFAAATVSRNIASIKAFFHFLNQEKIIDRDISEGLKAPKIEKRCRRF